MMQALLPLLAQAGLPGTEAEAAGWLPEGWLGIGILIAAVIVAGFISALIAAKLLYQKTSANRAMVRTGTGGAKVVVDGGRFVIPFLHEMRWINLESMRLVVTRFGKDALIALDRFRVDVEVEFYIRVEPLEEQVLRAARSLGDKSLTPDNVKSLVEAKLVGALRSVAATKRMIELHTNRQEFEDHVQDALREDLKKNGLTLESVAITHLDQTDKSALDPNNVFDAEGLKLITDATEKARKEKNEISRDAELAIKQKDVVTDIQIKQREAENELENNKTLQERDVAVKNQNIEADKRKLSLDQDLEFAAANQYKEVETYKAERAADTQRFKYEQEQAVKTREIEKNKAIEQAEIERELRVRESDLARRVVIAQKEQEAEEARISKEQAVEQAEIAKRIQIIAKIREQEAAEKDKLATVAEREAADQHVLTVQETASAERERQVAVISQRAEAEQKQIEREVAADAAAYEVRKKAEADAEAAGQQAQAIERIAEARLKEAEAQAEGERQLIEARNQTALPILMQEAAMELIKTTPSIISELMKPAEKISDIKILSLNGGGFGGAGAGHESNGNGAGGSLAGKVVGSVLEAGAAYPLLKELLKFAKVDLDTTSPQELVTKATDAVRTLVAQPSDGEPAYEVAVAEEPTVTAPKRKRPSDRTRKTT
jgi:uncharacterized membrane protein YqiK